MTMTPTTPTGAMKSELWPVDYPLSIPNNNELRMFASM
jgi:hypothetical protein